jgi:hypothetical protein
MFDEHARDSVIWFEHFRQLKEWKLELLCYTIQVHMVVDAVREPVRIAI